MKSQQNTWLSPSFRLYCSGCSLTSLDVSNNLALEYLACATNLITALDVTNKLNLETLGCSGNPITTLDLSQNTALSKLYIEQMPALTEVCVWTTPFPPGGFMLLDEDSPNVYFTTECIQ